MATAPATTTQRCMVYMIRLVCLTARDTGRHCSAGHREGDLEPEQPHDFFDHVVCATNYETCITLRRLDAIHINIKICTASSRTTSIRTRDIKLYDYIEL
jgi:hypothetical protein